MDSLAKGIADLSSLRDLELWNNELTNSGALALAQVLPHPRLQKIDLQGNKAISEEGIAILESAKLPCTDVDRRGERAICERVKTAALAKAECSLPRIYWDRP